MLAVLLYFKMYSYYVILSNSNIIAAHIRNRIAINVNYSF